MIHLRIAATVRTCSNVSSLGLHRAHSSLATLLQLPVCCFRLLQSRLCRVERVKQTRTMSQLGSSDHLTRCSHPVSSWWLVLLQHVQHLLAALELVEDTLQLSNSGLPSIKAQLYGSQLVLQHGCMAHS